jgi:peptidoglycan/LPS O-acetylase OafA/YrhL
LSSTKYRKDIQALRGMAVLAVVLFHSKDDFFPLGYLGVDVFFVISGFVVTPLILRIFTKPPEQKINWRFYNLRLFYERRFWRLAPALASTLFTSAALIFLFGPISDHQKFIDQGIATLFLIGNIGAYRYSESYFSPNPNPLIHTWSLSVEEQIYIFLPLIFMLTLKFRDDLKKVTVAIFTIITLLSLISFTFPHLLQSTFF